MIRLRSRSQAGSARRRPVRSLAGGLLVGVLGGWLAGLLRAPKREP